MLGLGKCQARNFASQIASTSLVVLQYNLLSIIKRFKAYGQWGNSLNKQRRILERIWGAILEIVIAIANILGLTDEEIYEAVINKSDELDHVCSIYKLKRAR